MQILTDLTKEINNFNQIFIAYDAKKTYDIRFLIENYNTCEQIIKSLNELHPDVKSEFDVSAVLDSTMYSEFMKIHKNKIKQIEVFAQNSSKVLEMILIFSANQAKGEKFYIDNITNTSSREDLLVAVQTIIKNVSDNDDEYVKELYDSSIKYQSFLRKQQSKNTTNNQQP